MSEVIISYGILHYNPQGHHEARKAFDVACASLACGAIVPNEVFVIDQGNCKEEMLYTQAVAALYGWQFVSLKKNVGISRGINLLARMGRGKYISLVTSDVQFIPGTDRIAIKAFESDPTIMQWCPASDNSDIPYQRAHFKTSGITPCIAQELTIQFWPRETFDVIGYFDERWKACYENLDYALRITLHGGLVVIDHDAYCTHDFHMSMRSGARDHAYDGYINMDGGFDQEPLALLWNQKWPSIARFIDVYDPGRLSKDELCRAYALYHHNVYLPYRQDVKY